MGEVNWSRHLDPPINTPDGKTLRTLKDAAEYVLALPKKVQAEPAWQLAAKELKNAAELDPAWRWFARSAMMNPILGPDKPPIGKVRETKAERFTAKRAAAKKRQ
jgi:hypothetical protein